jgi:hypothetical protein
VATNIAEKFSAIFSDSPATDLHFYRTILTRYHLSTGTTIARTTC